MVSVDKIIKTVRDGPTAKPPRQTLSFMRMSNTASLNTYVLRWNQSHPILPMIGLLPLPTARCNHAFSQRLHPLPEYALPPVDYPSAPKAKMVLWAMLQFRALRQRRVLSRKTLRLRPKNKLKSWASNLLSRGCIGISVRSNSRWVMGDK